MDNFLNPEEFNVDNLFKGKYNIPIYQRPYSWGRDEVEQLLKDIDLAYEKYLESNRTGSSVSNEEMLLFTGTLFIKINQNVKNAYTDYDIVDGQQRITTITLILMTILNHLYRVESEDDIVKDIENYLWKKTGRVKEKDKRVLSLGNIDKQIMIDYLTVCTPKMILSITQRINLKKTLMKLKKTFFQTLLLLRSIIYQILEAKRTITNTLFLLNTTYDLLL